MKSLQSEPSTATLQLMISADTAAACNLPKWALPRGGWLLIDQGIRAVRLCTERARQRRRLADLCDRLLKDIGLTHHDALVEARKPRWRR